jgi:hypothetical protein
MVGGNAVLYGPRNFLNRCLMTARDTYTGIRYKINDGNNIFGCMGGVCAEAKKLYRHLTIPADIRTDDSYMYMACKKKGYQFVNVRDAVVWHPCPENLQVHLKRKSRRVDVPGELSRYFDPVKVREEFFLPRSLLLQSTLKQLVLHPVTTLGIIIINRFGPIFLKHAK